MTDMFRLRISYRMVTRVLVVLGYVTLALWSTWPLARTPTSSLPVGIIDVTTVPLLNAWTMWWNSDRLVHGFAGYWNAPIFYPASETFAFSEPQPTTLLAAPVIWLTGSRVLAYNLYLCLSLVLNGVFTERLLRIVGVGRVVAVFSGMAMILLPIVHWQLDVLQLIPLWGILWTWTASLQASEHPNWLRGIEVGLAFSVAFLTCGHQGLFLAALLIGSVWVLVRKWFSTKTWMTWIAAAIVVLVLAGPTIIHMRRVLSPKDFDRNPKLVEDLSVKPTDYVAAAGSSLINLKIGETESFWKLSPGWIKVGLASLAIVFGLFRRRWRRWTAFLFLIGLLAFLLSMGPHLQIRGWQPWWTLTHVMPGFSRVRNVFRFAFFVQMAVVLLAGQGLYFLSITTRWSCRSRIWRTILNLGVLSLGLTAVFEVRPAKVELRPTPEILPNLAWIDFLRTQTPAGKAIVCLPFPTNVGIEDFESTARWMYFGTFHGVPLVNGYSGFFPREYFELQDVLGNKWPPEATLRKLAESNVEFIVVNTLVSPIRNLQVVPYQTISVERVLQDPVRIEIYRLRLK
ncbi:MAG: hypothetical protein JWM11_7319 [Planctomycetaceae bacterium]|nr:hypothetical protein [Planctomycetaceae bacterium]